MSAAALKKHNDTPELIEALPQLDGLSDTDPEYEEAVHKAVAQLRRDADTLEKQGQLKLKNATNLRSKASALENLYPPTHQPPSSPKTGRWEDLKIGDALWAYMKQLDFDDKRLLTEVADALLKAGVDPGSPSGGRKAKNRTPQKTMIANIRKSAIHRGCKCDDDRFEDDKIWRVRTP